MRFLCLNKVLLVCQLLLFITNKPAVSDSSQAKSSSDLEPVELDINSKKETDQYSYSTGAIEDIVIYSTKQGYGFNKIKEGSTLIWEAKDNKNFAVFVRVIGSDNVTLRLIDDTTKEFESTGGCCSKKWNDVTLNVQSSQDSQNLKGNSNPNGTEGSATSTTPSGTAGKPDPSAVVTTSITSGSRTDQKKPEELGESTPSVPKERGTRAPDGSSSLRR